MDTQIQTKLLVSEILILIENLDIELTPDEVRQLSLSDLQKVKRDLEHLSRSLPPKT